MGCGEGGSCLGALGCSGLGRLAHQGWGEEPGVRLG